MTIQEVEARCGMTRANIRFYEREGLLQAPRLENGYRDYTQENVQTLLRIRLLRSLHVSLDDIRALQSGEKALSDTLRVQIEQLEREAQQAQAAGAVCREIEAEHVAFSELDAPKYLRRLEEGVREEPQCPPDDRVPYPCCPVRRFFARTLDWLLCCAAARAILMLLGMTPQTKGADGVTILLAAALTAVLEPALLHAFGTTPGKWLLGLSVEWEDGSRLSWTDGLARLWDVAWKGCGLGIPILRLFRLYKCFSCAGDERMPWDEELTLTLRDRRPWRTAAYLGAVGLVVFANLTVFQLGQLPPHRGALTQEMFVENFGFYERYCGYDFAMKLQSDGTWKDEPQNGAFTMFVSDVPLPPLHFETEDGAVTKVWFEAAVDGTQTLVGSFYAERYLAALSLSAAGKENGLYSGAVQKLARAIPEALSEGSSSVTAAGVTATCEVESTGYWFGTEYVVADDDTPEEDRQLWIRYTVELEE